MALHTCTGVILVFKNWPTLKSPISFTFFGKTQLFSGKVLVKTHVLNASDIVTKLFILELRSFNFESKLSSHDFFQKTNE